jgi:hypothetical protein
MDQEALSHIDNPEWLKEKYEAERLSITQIAGLLGCSTTPVRLRLIRLGIPIRSSAVAELLHPRTWTPAQKRAMSARRVGSLNPMAGKPNLGTRGPNYHPDRRQAYARATRFLKYGITGVEFDQLLESQGVV